MFWVTSTTRTLAATKCKPDPTIESLWKVSRSLLHHFCTESKNSLVNVQGIFSIRVKKYNYSRFADIPLTVRAPKRKQSFHGPPTTEASQAMKKSASYSATENLTGTSAAKLPVTQQGMMKTPNHSTPESPRKHEHTSKIRHCASVYGDTSRYEHPSLRSVHGTPCLATCQRFTSQ